MKSGGAKNACSGQFDVGCASVTMRVCGMAEFRTDQHKRRIISGHSFNVIDRFEHISANPWNNKSFESRTTLVLKMWPI